MELSRKVSLIRKRRSSTGNFDIRLRDSESLDPLEFRPWDDGATPQGGFDGDVGDAGGDEEGEVAGGGMIEIRGERDESSGVELNLEGGNVGKGGEYGISGLSRDGDGISEQEDSTAHESCSEDTRGNSGGGDTDKDEPAFSRKDSFNGNLQADTVVVMLNQAE